MAKKKRTKTEAQENPSIVTISFKIGIELFTKLESYSKDKTDENGLPLTPPMVARLLMLENLKKKTGY